MVNALFRKQKSLYFRGLRIKKDPALASLKALMQGLFVYVGGLAIFALIQNKWQCPETENLFPLNGSRWFRCDIIHDTVNMLYFVYDAARDFI